MCQGDKDEQADIRKARVQIPSLPYVWSIIYRPYIIS